MYDQGAAETDRLIAELEERIRVEYTQAEREIKEKLDKYLRAFRTKDAIWQRWVAQGKKTEKEYSDWRVGQIAIGERWEEMRRTIAEDLLNANKIALSIAKDYCADAYTLNHDYGTYQVEHDSLTDTSYTLYNRDTAQRVLSGNIQLLPGPGKTLSKDIKDGKAMRWNQSHIQSVMMQALLQGNSIPDIATRLSNAVGGTGRKAATRDARTMMTNAQNTGRLDAFQRGKDMGIPVKKQWVATLDGRTRHEHRLLDGMVQDLDKEFVVEDEKIMKPGDPNAPPHLVYNCRCTMRASIKGYEHDLSDTSERYNKKLGGMSYDEWKQGKAKSKPILAQEEKSDKARAKYIREYRGFGGPVASGRDTTLDIDSKAYSFGNAKPEKQPVERIRRGQVDTGYTGVIRQENLDEYNAKALAQIIADTGFSEEYAREVQKSLQGYMSSGYRDYIEGKRPEDVARINDYVAHAPVYDGPTYRGLVFDTDEDEGKAFFDAFSNLEVGSEISMGRLSSWSSRLSVANRYMELDRIQESVILRCSENRTGTGVSHISKMGDHEAEVINTGDSRWRVTGVMTMSKEEYADTILQDAWKRETDKAERKAIGAIQDGVFSIGDNAKWYYVTIIDVEEIVE